MRRRSQSRGERLRGQRRRCAGSPIARYRLSSGQKKMSSRMRDLNSRPFLSSGRRLSLRKEAEPHDAKIPKEVSKSCDINQKLGSKPNHFKVTLSNKAELVFGEEVSMDLMSMGGKSILHMICTSTRFSAAVFVDFSEADYDQGSDGL
eukprot:IDg6436t1